MSVTIRDVAAAAGVSTATVSKVINRYPTISQETIEHVQEVIRKLGYRPNKRAQSFAKRATKNILFLSELEHGVGFENPHLFEMMVGSEAALAEEEYGLLIKRIHARELVNSFDDIMDSKYVDGAIVHASVVSREVAALMTDTFFPYVVIGMPDFSNRLCWIDTNNSVAGQIAASHLKENGYERIAFIGGSDEDTISLHRLEGVLEALDPSLPVDYIRHGDPKSDTGFQCTMELLSLENPPEAIICANQYLAFGCVEALRQSHISIPDEMAVLTFDDFPFSKVIDPPLTVVNLDMYDMGEQAAKIIIRRIKNPKLLVQSYTTLPSLIERESTKRTE
ncbi:MAG: LacI family transcriptional regulator [Clostridiaceae bacterium]|jgi:DNA-binding LacI/PurR family transcriptional regulator|nr:LacI family transcriptional regulator [Clostridiaceae bacterium]